MVTRTRGRPAVSDGIVVNEAQLLNAVLEAFADKGFEGTSVREVARSLNVSHNLIPQRYGSKERLWYAAVDFGFTRLQQDLVNQAQSLGSDELLILRGLIASFIENNAAHPALLRIINQEASRPGPRLDYLFDTYIKPVRDFGDAWLIRLATEGLIADVSVTLLYFLMTHGAGGMFALPALTSRLAGTAQGPGYPDVKEQVEQAVSLIFDGLLVRK